MQSLLGHPLDVLVGMLEDYEYMRLYMTGNILIQKRIKKCPLTCRWFPLKRKYSQNVVEVTACEVTKVYNNGYATFEKLPCNCPDDEDCSCHYERRESRKCKIPSTLKRFGVECTEGICTSLLPLLPKVTDLLLFMELVVGLDGESLGFDSFPRGLEKLTLGGYELSMIQNIPVTLTSLELEELPLDNMFENEIDLRFLANLEEFRCATENSFIIPNNLRVIKDYTRHLEGAHPNLERAKVHSIEGSYPALKKLTVSGGNLSGVNKSCEIVIFSGKRPLSRYEDGELLLYSEDRIEMMTPFPVTSIEFVDKDITTGDYYRFLKLNALFPLLEEILFDPTCTLDGVRGSRIDSIFFKDFISDYEFFMREIE